MKHEGWLITNGEQGQKLRYVASLIHSNPENVLPGRCCYWTQDIDFAFVFLTESKAHNYMKFSTKDYEVVPFSWNHEPQPSARLYAAALSKLQNSWVATFIIDIQRCLRERRYKRMIARIERSERIRKATTVPPMQPLLPKQERVARQIAKQARDAAMIRNRERMKNDQRKG